MCLNKVRVITLIHDVIPFFLFELSFRPIVCKWVHLSLQRGPSWETKIKFCGTTIVFIIATCKGKAVKWTLIG